MNIYFSGSIKGADHAKENYPLIITELQKHGKVLTEHIANILQGEENNIATTPQGVFQADKKMLDQADIVVADITAPSLGVGWELCYAEQKGLPIHCLYQQGHKISRMIKGNLYINFHPYTSKDEISSLITDLFEKET